MASADCLSAVEIYGGDSRNPWSTCSSNSPSSKPGFFCFSGLLFGRAYHGAAVDVHHLLRASRPSRVCSTALCQHVGRLANTPSIHMLSFLSTHERTSNPLTTHNSAPLPDRATGMTKIISPCLIIMFVELLYRGPKRPGVRTA